MANKNDDFQQIMRSMLMEKAKDSNGEEILINGKKCNVLKVLCKLIISKSYKDANLAKWVLMTAGIVPPDEKADTGLNAFLEKLTKTGK